MTNPSYYAILPAAVRYNKNLTLLQKVLYAELTCLAELNGFAYPTNRYFSKLYDITVQHVSTQLSELQNQGHIEIKIDKEKANSRQIFIVGLQSFTIKKNLNSPIKKNLNTYNTTSKNNTTSIKTSSKEDSSSQKNGSSKNKSIVKKKSAKKKQTLPAIKKKSAINDPDSFTPKKPIPKAKYKYTMKDQQLYNELIECGATKHRVLNKEGVPLQAFFNTMNAIHELFNPAIRNPYSASKSIPDDYKTKKWTFDEIVDTFKYYISIADKIYYKSISMFLYCNGYGTKTWSPLVKFHIDMNKDNGTTLEGDEKKLMKGLKNINITELDAKAVKRTIKLLDLYSEGYRVNQQLNHLYFGSIIPLFIAHVKTNLRNVKFKPVYIQGEQFMKQFISDTTKDRSLIKGNNGYASI